MSVAISGSPSLSSKSARLADYALGLVARDGVETEHILVRSLDAVALMSGDVGEPSVATLIEKVGRAHGVVLATPIFKAAYSGLLKAALDLLPQYAMAGKVVLPLATGGSPAMFSRSTTACGPSYSRWASGMSSKATSSPDAQMNSEPFELQPAARAPLLSAVENFLHSLTSHTAARWLGHPQPPAGSR